MKAFLYMCVLFGKRTGIIFRLYRSNTHTQNLRVSRTHTVVSKYHFPMKEMRAWRNVDSMSGGGKVQDKPRTPYYSRKRGKYQTLIGRSKRLRSQFKRVLTGQRWGM